MKTATRQKRPAMTAEEALEFPRKSLVNAVIVSHTLKCGCQPYRDVFTYRRWLAQGYQVRRGEHSIKLGIVKQVERETEDGDTEILKVFGNSHVFCRCQVDPVQK